MQDLTGALIGASRFTAKDQEFGKKISLALEKVGIKKIEQPYFETSTDNLK